MQVFERERELQRQIEAAVQAGAPDIDVVAVELLAPDRFCVFIDHEDGVDHALCERVTGLLRSFLDRYTVDVSSPGLERPLRTRAHFAAAEGRRAAVRTGHEIAGRKRFRGAIVAVRDEALELEVPGAGRFDIPYAEIVRSNLIYEG